jgi:hypothetical protein
MAGAIMENHGFEAIEAVQDYIEFSTRSGILSSVEFWNAVRSEILIRQVTK